jgi:predicted ester cyclase
VTAQENKQVLVEYLEALSGKPKTAEIIDKYVVAPALKQHILDFEAGFPNYSGQIEDIVAEGDLVAIRATFEGTHRNEFMGVPPTGKDVTINAMIFYRMQDGKIVDFWMNADMAGLMQQLGAAPAAV